MNYIIEHPLDQAETWEDGENRKIILTITSFIRKCKHTTNEEKSASNSADVTKNNIAGQKHLGQAYAKLEFYSRVTMAVLTAIKAAEYA